RFRHFDDVRHDLAGGRVLPYGIHEGLVDLEVIEPEFLQVRKAGIAGTKIVDGDFDVEGMDVVQDSPRDIGLHEAALGRLDQNILRLYAHLADHLPDEMPHQRLLEILGGQVDANVELRACFQQHGSIACHYFHDFRGDGVDKVGFLGHGNEQ